MAGGIGDRAGFAHGMKVIGVNNKTFSRQRLLDALAQSVKRHKIEFLLVEGEDFRTVVLDYSGGPRYLELVRDPVKARPAGRDPQAAGKAGRSLATGFDQSPRHNRSLGPPKGYVCYQAASPDPDRRPSR